MEQQCRHKKASHNLRPVNFPVKSVQLSAEMERPENKGNQAKHIKVHGARSVPPADENEQTDEQIKQANDAQIIFRGQGLFGRRREQGGLEFLTVAGKPVVNLAPKSCTIQPPGNFCSPCDSGAVDGQQDIARTDPGSSCRRIRRNPAGLNPMVGIQPSNTVVYHFKPAALIEVNERKNDRSQRGQRQHDRPKARSEVLPHKSTGQDCTPPEETKCNPMSIVWSPFIRGTPLYSTGYCSGRAGYPASSCFWKDKYSF